MPKVHVTYEVEVPYGLVERLENAKSGRYADDPTFETLDDILEELRDHLYEQKVLLGAPVSVEFA